jgi:hypothetical protein
MIYEPQFTLRDKELIETYVAEVLGFRTGYDGLNIRRDLVDEFNISKGVINRYFGKNSIGLRTFAILFCKRIYSAVRATYTFINPDLLRAFKSFTAVHLSNVLTKLFNDVIVSKKHGKVLMKPFDTNLFHSLNMNDYIKQNVIPPMDNYLRISAGYPVHPSSARVDLYQAKFVPVRNLYERTGRDPREQAWTLPPSANRIEKIRPPQSPYDNHGGRPSHGSNDNKSQYVNTGRKFKCADNKTRSVYVNEKGEQFVKQQRDNGRGYKYTRIAS